MRQDIDDPRGAPLDVARGRLDAATTALRAFLRGSEDVFLDAGRRVAGLERMARGLVDGARAAGTFRTGAQAEDPAVILGREFVRMHQHLLASRTAFAGGAEHLGQLLAQVDVMQRTQAHFAGIPPTLRMLGLNTRIENARASAQYAGMETVALEVRRLGDVVEPKFHAVFAQAGCLLGTVKTALDAAQDFLQGQESSCGDILDQMQDALAALQAFTRTGAEIADHAAASSERLARELGGLLVALQGHDATRQAIEHVIADLEDAAATGGAGGRLAEAARLAAAQVQGARERFGASLDGIAGYLHALAAAGAELSRETARLASVDTGTSPATVVRKGVDRVTHCLLQHVAHETVTGDAMREVVSTVEQMERAVKDIQGIGSAVKIIALNALVETERAGQNGRVLAVLAQGIGTLAGEVVQRTGEVSTTLEAIAAGAERLRATASRGTAREGDQVARELERLSLRLSEIHRGLQGAVGAMHQGSVALAGEVRALAARVDEARAAAARLLEVEDTLAALGDAEGEAATPAELQGAAYARYTMESERTIHDRVIGGLTRPAEPAQPSHPSSAGDGLGANVELF